jgi:hypothetical protein
MLASITNAVEKLPVVELRISINRSVTLVTQAKGRPNAKIWTAMPPVTAGSKVAFRRYGGWPAAIKHGCDFLARKRMAG